MRMAGGPELTIVFTTYKEADKVELLVDLLSTVLATFIVITSNYFLNNLLTFNAHKHKGIRALPSLLCFYLTYSLGALINVAVAALALNAGITRWLAGICGAFSGAVWNFAMSTTYIWKRSRVN